MSILYRRSKTRLRKVQYSVIAILVVANLLVWVLSLRTLHHSKELYDRRAQTLVQNIATVTEQSISDSFTKVDLTLSNIVDELERQLGTSGIETVRGHAFIEKQLSRIPEVGAIRVEDKDGWIFLTTGKPLPTRTNVSDRDYFQFLRGQSEQRLTITKPILSRVNQQYLILVARRYNYPDGRFAGVVHATVPVEHLYNLLAHF